MYKNYAQQLTKDDLINKYGITAVDPDGKVYNKYGEFNYSIMKSGKRKYNVIATYDHMSKPKVNIGKYGKGSYTYKSVTLGVHRIVWVWYNGIQHEGMVIDHIDNDPLNNNLSNLQEITPAENLAKDRKKVKILKPSLLHDLDWHKNKLAEYIVKYEKAKKDHDAEAAHNYGNSISNYRAKIRDWELNKGEYDKILSIKKSRQEEAKNKSIQYHKIAKEKKHLKSLVNEARKIYKDNPTIDNKYNWRLAIKVYNDFIEKTKTFKFLLIHNQLHY